MQLLGTVKTLIDSNLLLPAEYHYNPAVFRWQGKLFLIYRMQNGTREHPEPSNIAIAELDTSLKPISNKLIHLNRAAEDPRVFVFKDQPYICTADGSGNLYLTKLNHKLEVEQDFKLPVPENRCQKNWNFFPYEGKLFVFYSYDPFQVYEINLNDLNIKLKWDHGKIMDWKWGQPRGGAGPVLIGEYLFHFFHSGWAHPLAHIEPWRIYCVGHLVTKSEPPFEPLFYSKEPLEIADLKSPRLGPTNSAVVFPCGAIASKNHILLSQGVNDHHIELAKIDFQELRMTEVRINGKK